MLGQNAVVLNDNGYLMQHFAQQAVHALLGPGVQLIFDLEGGN